METNQLSISRVLCMLAQYPFITGNQSIEITEVVGEEGGMGAGERGIALLFFAVLLQRGKPLRLVLLSNRLQKDCICYR